MPSCSSRSELRTCRLLKRRQIRGSRLCAEATALLLRRVVESFKAGDALKLIENVQHVGRILIAAQPKELAVGNIVLRVLGLIREELEEDRDGENSTYSETGSESHTPSLAENDQRNFRDRLTDSQRTASSPLRNGVSDTESVSIREGTTVQAGTFAPRTMFSLLSQPHQEASSILNTARDPSPAQRSSLSRQALANLDAAKDLRAEVVEGILEILEELKQADEQIASYALEHIHSNEIILTQSSSETVRKFLLKAAAKRKFTVLYTEAFPNDHEATHSMVTGDRDKISGDAGSDRFHKTLTMAGVTVVLLPDSAVFAVMSRVNKVILDTHVVIGNGGLIATAGAKQIAQTARVHRTPVVVLSGVYKLSPIYPFDVNVFLEDGDPGRVIGYEDQAFNNKILVENPLFDYIPANLIDIYITNL